MEDVYAFSDQEIQKISTMSNESLNKKYGGKIPCQTRIGKQ